MQRKQSYIIINMENTENTENKFIEKDLIDFAIQKIKKEQTL